MISERLGEALSAMREAIRNDRSASIFNTVPAGVSRKPDLDAPVDYLDFLALADGAIFGSVVVIGTKHIAGAQRWISPGMLDVALKAEEWFVFGRANENPVLLNRPDGSIWTFPNMKTTWWASTEFARISSCLSDFVLHYALGPGYLSLTDSDMDDQWWQVLRRTGRVD